MYLGVDIGATKTLLAIIDTAGAVKESIKFATPDKYDDFVAKLAVNVDKLSTKGFTAACVAVPGRLDRAEGVGVAFGNRPWTNVPIGPDFEKLLHCPVTLENDSKLAGLSEAQPYKDQYRKILYLTISTGIGGALIVDGRLDPLFADIELGQLLLEHNGRLTDWEDFGSGRAFQARFGKRVSDIDPDDRQAWYYIARQIAIGLIDLIVTLTPDAVIIGGGAGGNLAKFEEPLHEQLKIYENPLVPIPPILPAKHPEEAVIYGCYELLKDKYAKVVK